MIRLILKKKTSEHSCFTPCHYIEIVISVQVSLRIFILNLFHTFNHWSHIVGWANFLRWYGNALAYIVLFCELVLFETIMLPKNTHNFQYQRGPAKIISNKSNAWRHKPTGYWISYERIILCVQWISLLNNISANSICTFHLKWLTFNSGHCHKPIRHLLVKTMGPQSKNFNIFKTQKNNLSQWP